MKVENIRVPVSDSERNPVLKDMSENGYTLVAVTDDGYSDGRLRIHHWSLYFTKTIPSRQFDPCCERDNDDDGSCDIHSAPGVFRNKAFTV